MTVGENIKRLRKERKLTQKKLGELSGVSEAMIRQYELGLRKPKIQTLNKIANGMNLDTNFLIGTDYEYNERYFPDTDFLIKKLDCFIAFIKSMDYLVNDKVENTKMPICNFPDDLKASIPKSHIKNDNIIGEYVEGESFHYELIKDKKILDIEENELEQLMNDTTDFIEYSLWKLEQNKSK